MSRANTKRTKVTNLDHIITPSVDIISSLPGPILCHILSFLSTKESVASSILARRWRFLWTQVMNIKFETRRDNMDSEEFSDIVNRVLLLNTAQCNTFSLRFSTPYDEWCSGYQFETWITTVVSRNVKVLDLWVHHMFKLPRCLFTSKTLVELKIEEIMCLSVGNVCLPNLKKLHLVYVSYDNDETLPKLISGCLVLEELRIQNTLDGNSISSPTLKRLTLDTMDEIWTDGIYKCMLKLDTPALQYLNLQDHLYERISSRNLSSIVEADIYLKNNLLKEDISYLCSLFGFVESVSMVKCLKFSCPFKMKLLSTTISASTMQFHNLIKLDFEADWRLLTKLLESADKLEVLIIRKVKYNLKFWREPEKVPVCLLSCLRAVAIHQSGCGEPDFKMIRYIMKNAMFLTRMEIHSDMKPDARLRISNFCRGSEACEVDFIYE